MSSSEKNDNKKKISAVVFLILALASFLMGISTIVVGVLLFALSIFGFNSAEKMIKSAETPTQPVSQPAGEKVAFKENRLDLGERSDGCFYTVILMIDEDYYKYPGNDGEYIVLKKNGSVPSVEYDEYFIESGQLHPYLISNNLGTDDFSDMINDSMVEDNPEIFEGRTDMVFSVIDMDSDIIKTSEDYQKEKDDGYAKIFEWLFGYIVILLLSCFGVLLALIQGIIAFPSFILFMVFTVLFIVFCVKLRKEER